MSRQLSEQEKVEELASRYRDQGYRTIVRPNSNDLPEFLRSYQPDVVAFGEHENVVIEVKSSEALVGDRKVAEIAEAIDKHEGWRFELVALGTRKQRPPALVMPQESLGIPEVRRRIDASQRLLKAGQSEAALLLGWSAVEALLRLSLHSKDVQLRNEQPRLLVKEAYIQGFLGWRDYRSLLEGLHLRTRIAHGWKTKTSLRRKTGGLLRLSSRLIESLQEYSRRTRSPKNTRIKN